MSRAHIKPLIHWAIGKGYTLRMGARTPTRVVGIVTTPAGEAPFAYDPMARLITLGVAVAAPAGTKPASTEPVNTEPSATIIAINEYGWEEKNP